MKSLLLILLIFILSSCAATKTVYVPVENKTTEYITKVDSIWLQDSIYYYIHTKNDTVYSTKEVYKLKEVTKKDTIMVKDTIPIPVEIEKIVVTNKLTKLQQFLQYIGIISLILIVISAIFKIAKHIK